MGQRFRNVYKDLVSEELKIEQPQPSRYDFENEFKSQKIGYLKQQSEDIRRKIDEINTSLNENDSKEASKLLDQNSVSRMMYDKEKLKEFE